MKSAFFVALACAAAAAAASAAAPPSCLLTALLDQPDPSDVATVCGKDQQPRMLASLAAVCAGDDLAAAYAQVTDVCAGQGIKVGMLWNFFEKIFPPSSSSPLPYWKTCEGVACC
jgi:hypothetical protein